MATEPTAPARECANISPGNNHRTRAACRQSRDRLPKAESAITNRNVRGNVQPAALQVDEQLAPALGAFSSADLEADEFFLALGRRAEQHQHAVAMLFHAGLRAAPTMAGRALEAQMAIERQKPDRERFWGNANIAFAENDPIFRSGWFERLDEGLPQVFGHRDFTAASLALESAIDEMDGVSASALGVSNDQRMLLISFARNPALTSAE